MEQDILEQILEGVVQPMDLPLETMRKITDGFSADRIIGEGDFGSVYLGIVGNKNVAVKRMKGMIAIDLKHFRSEVDSLMEANHQNIIRLLGFCSSTVQRAMKNEVTGRGYIYAQVMEKMFCYEYLSEGSLDKHITDELRGLEWDTRFQIITGICEGLHYLHTEKQILHMDLRPSHILLDNRMVPKISGFILSRPAENSQAMSSIHYASRYCAPEIRYGHGRRITFKSDMYSLGVIIIEIVTGHRGIPDNNKKILRRWRHRWNKLAKTTPLVYQEQVTKCIEIGALCQKEGPSERPSTSDIMSKIGEMESTNNPIENANESTVDQERNLEDDMLGVEPLDLVFACSEHNNVQILSCSVELSNDTNGLIAFMIEACTLLLPFSINPNRGIVPPQSKCRVDITCPAAHTHVLDKDPLVTTEFIMRSMKVNGILTTKDINEDMFYEDTVGHNIDEVQLVVVSDSSKLQSRLTSEEPCSNESYEDRESGQSSESISALLSSFEISDQAIELKTLEGILMDANANPVRLSYPFLRSITGNFSQEIGRGGFGVVYQGDLGPRKVAVKKLSIMQRFSEALFLGEVTCLIKAKHSNIVRFLGYCADTHGEYVQFDGRLVLSEVPQRLLCFEYVPKGSLQKHLEDKSHQDEWQIRYQMIRGICHGLNYLHGQRIIHLDLKPDNILLDALMNPKITDFGISKCFDEGITRIHTENVRGTRGSIAPETIDSGEITYKSDIYGLGNIIIHLLTGRNKYDFQNWHTSIDVDGPQVKSCIEIAKKCVAFNQHERPTIGEIIQKLDEIEKL